MAENTAAALDNNDITLTPTTPKKKKKSQNECLPTRPALDNTNKHVARQQWGVNAKLEIVNNKKKAWFYCVHVWPSLRTPSILHHYHSTPAYSRPHYQSVTIMHRISTVLSDRFGTHH